MTLKEYENAMRIRRDTISRNAGQRLARNPAPQLPIPPKPEHPVAVQLSNADGYVGTWAIGVSVEDAVIEAEEAGSVGPFKVKMVKAYR